MRQGEEGGCQSATVTYMDLASRVGLKDLVRGSICVTKFFDGEELDYFWDAIGLDRPQAACNCQ